MERSGTPSLSAPLKPRRRAGWNHLWLPLTLTFLALLIPWREQFVFDVDEGYNLMRALLVQHGYALYTDIWCDQPPLLILVLSGTFKLLGPTLLTARLTGALFFVLLCGCLYALVTRRRGPFEGLVAVLFFLSAAFVVQIGASAMETAPSLGLAMLSLCLADRARDAKRTRYSLLAGVVLAAAVLVKLNALLFFPLTLVLLGRDPSRRVPAQVTAAGAFALATALLGFLIFRNGVGPIWSTHALARNLPQLAHLEGTRALPRLFTWDREYLLLAVLGVLITWRAKSRALLFPLGWLLYFTALFWFHRPVWYHYYVLLALPLTWLAAAGLREILILPGKRWPATGMLLAGGAALLLVCGLKFVRNRRQTHDARYRLEQPVLGFLETVKNQTNWVLAFDRQIYPFTTGQLVPPEMAVTSWKRNFLGELNPAIVHEVLTRYQPEVVLLPADLHFQPALEQMLRKDYTPVYAGKQTQLYARGELFESARGGE